MGDHAVSEGAGQWRGPNTGMKAVALRPLPCGDREGYDLEVLGVPVRLYDDVRSDEVMSDPDFKSGRRTWDEAFGAVAERMKGEVDLNLMVDYWHERPGDHTPVVERITRILVDGGHGRDHIGTEYSAQPDGSNGRGR